MTTIPEIGQRIVLREMTNDPDPIPPGTGGVVTHVTLFANPLPSSASVWEDGKLVQTQLPAVPVEAQVSVDWDNGRSLMLLVPKDSFYVVPRGVLPVEVDA